MGIAYAELEFGNIRFWVEEKGGAIRTEKAGSRGKYDLNDADQEFGATLKIIIAFLKGRSIDRLFKNCYKLTGVKLQSDRLEVHDCEFENCYNLISVQLPNGLKTINAGAFYGCTALKNLDLPESVKNIGGEAFARTGIEYMKLPSGIEHIDADAFEKCNIKELVFDEEHPVYEFKEKCLIDKEKHEILKAFNGAAIPNGIVTIRDKAFDHTDIGTALHFPDSVRIIGNRAFDSIDSLKRIYLNDNISVIRENAFLYCKNLEEIYYHGEIYRSSRLIAEIAEYEGTNISIYAFDGCKCHTQYKGDDAAYGAKYGFKDLEQSDHRVW